MQPKTSFSQEEVERLTDRIQNAGTEVVNAKAGAVSEPREMAIIAFHFIWYCSLIWSALFCRVLQHYPWRMLVQDLCSR